MLIRGTAMVARLPQHLKSPASKFQSYFLSSDFLCQSVEKLRESRATYCAFLVPSRFVNKQNFITLTSPKPQKQYQQKYQHKLLRRMTEKRIPWPQGEEEEIQGMWKKIRRSKRSTRSRSTYIFEDEMSKDSDNRNFYPFAFLLWISEFPCQATFYWNFVRRR